MPENDDKYPPESGRRRFVKGVVGSASLAAVGVGSAASLGAATSDPGAGGGITTFLGIENTDGPAPRGMPIIPLEIDSEGALKGVWPDTIQDGVAQTTIGGEQYLSSWFQYCGVQTVPGVEPGADRDNFFRSAPEPPYDWQSESKSEGDKLFVEDFADYEEWGNGIGQSGLGKPAVANWRSTDVPPQDSMVVQVLRSTRIQEYIDQGGEHAQFIDAATDQGIMAWLNKCTHFCCVPSFKGLPGSAAFGAENRVYCQCHQSVYNPFSPVKKSFVALPRPEE